MDKQTDEKAFGALMDQLHAAFREGFNAQDGMKVAYWNVLKDMTFREVKANVERAIALAKPETPLPRPASLRNRPSPVAAAPPSAAQERADRQSARHWDEMKQADPIGFEIEWRACRAFASMAQCEDGSEEHQEWTREYQRWGRLRYLPRNEQEAAVRTYLGQSIEKRNAVSDASLRTRDRE